MQDFAGKVAVITGAGSGFGREFAHKLAQRGAKLVLADIEESTLNAVRDELTAQGAEVLTMRLDVSKGAEVEALAAATMARFGVVHLLFNNAGVGSGGLIWENTVKDWEWVLGVNLWGVIHGIRVFLPLMLEKMYADPDYSGHVVNTSSVAGLLSPPNMGVYNVSKHGVVTLTETLYHDLRLIGARIGVSVLCPAYVNTNIIESQRNRPEELANHQPPTPSQAATQAILRKAVGTGKLSAGDIAEQTLAAIREDRFYVITHQNIMKSVNARHSDIAEQRNPTDTFQFKSSGKSD